LFFSQEVVVLQLLTTLEREAGDGAAGDTSVMAAVASVNTAENKRTDERWAEDGVEKAREAVDGQEKGRPSVTRRDGKRLARASEMVKEEKLSADERASLAKAEADRDAEQAKLERVTRMQELPGGPAENGPQGRSVGEALADDAAKGCRQPLAAN
jgi:hypothetical protein